MVTVGSARNATSALERLQGLELRLPQLARRELAEILAPLVEQLHEPLPPESRTPVAEGALAFCRTLYASARSADALPLASAVLAQGLRCGDERLQRLARMACGILSADAGDVVAAIEHHVAALRFASAAGDRIEMSSVWNNIGLAMGIAGNYEMAARCYRRAFALVEHDREPVFVRYAALVNLADSNWQIGRYSEGLEFGERAVAELQPDFLQRDIHSALLLRRNIVRLLIGIGRVADAQPHVAALGALADASRTPRAAIAAATTRAVFEMAKGQTDIALTRLEQALTRARQLPAALRDTLAHVIRAEEAAGNPERALLRLSELSEHIYRSAIQKARQHVELASVMATANPLEQEQAQARARLAAQLDPPERPEGWDALDRLAVTAVLRMDSTGWHGKRVGALTKALAVAAGVPPLEALEMGMAADIHDIGMLSVPEGILSKKGALNDAERLVVRRHVDAGAEILGDDRHPRMLMAREIARYHHAHWDGEGYPERVGGKLIPLPARICAVADAYDAMVCGLGARPARSMDEALAELQRVAGSQFDPELVATFENLVRSESEDLGMDLTAPNGMESFQELVGALQEDRGFA